MVWLENLLLLLGFAIVLIAYGRYVRRTQDVRGVLMFWARRLSLSASEFRLQRSGIVLMLLGVVLRYLNMLEIL
ncbi:hypothetical protein FGL86_08105 [Pistricoccus aurantiacus]|uniref:Uncharacterized protein n=2 Tax=Pistricoccus aurantiacus TaxID=1883414 RepID=A0A5B8T1D6_9GAMM|nr:hypothetical protein FGL86_08105 [Pistricoccus aurantiacus]